MFDYKPDRPKVLLVDEKIQNLILIKDILIPLDLDLYIAKTGQEALERVAQTDFDMILLETMMSDMDGYEVCRQIKSLTHEHDLSILFMSELQTHEDKAKGFESGADDYLVKPFYEKEMFARVQLHLKKRTVIKYLKSLLKRSYHELYNPLSVIKTSAEMYGYHYPKNSYVDTMHAAAKSLHLIYEDLYYALETKKKGPLRNDFIDLAVFVRKRTEYFILLAEVKNIRIELETEDQCFIEIPPSDLQRIVDNTISNAIKYSFENTIIRIYLKKNSHITLRVTNHGSTIINPHYIFSDGYREAYDTVGMGVGLEIVASICQRHNIRSKVESKDGTTTFTYTFKGGDDESHSA
ncbi:response regulator receiver sensor signal transduction histidine kinase [Sulfuricurvum kujiense DSM 16994]|uniref:Response regulator receiver sensor signal transduction histidine kinase n=1 Tax=Sulfuricurvum kujiense (strain ATCC BAA-921 / DSM 16994 / JCM 11577 / YK-1) TaxID=709032 RepID=E4U0L3_SULKY|nr:hybrid sensor histidine kinase/response regulator [Sulfuricurvum kujiense]ADR34330.1 response regulator receiver sensor signal transduction histidine kinase [Sulfuricurvum kujiense DSM 16994]